jgi:hypothetical protein
MICYARIISRAGTDRRAISRPASLLTSSFSFIAMCTSLELDLAGWLMRNTCDRLDQTTNKLSYQIE